MVAPATPLSPATLTTRPAVFTMADPGVHDADPRVHPADPGVHDADPGVHDGPIRVFTMRRSARSRSAGARKLVVHAPTM